MTEKVQHPNPLISWSKPEIIPREHGQAQEIRDLYHGSIEGIISRPLLMNEVVRRGVRIAKIIDGYPELIAAGQVQDLPGLGKADNDNIRSVLPKARFNHDRFKQSHEVMNMPYGDFILSNSALVAIDPDSDEGFSWEDNFDAHPTISITSGDFEVPVEITALIIAQSALVMRLRDENLPPLKTRLPLEYSSIGREFLEKERFRDIDAAYRFLNEHLDQVMETSDLYRTYTAGLLSILQTVSVFPDIYLAFIEGRKDDFVKMVATVTQALPQSGVIGPSAINGLIFEQGCLVRDTESRFGFRVSDDIGRVWENMRKRSIERIASSKEYRAQSNLHDLYSGRSRVTYRPESLPYNNTDDTPCPGTLVVEPARPTSCPANVGSDIKTNIVMQMASVLYDQSRSVLETGSVEDIQDAIKEYDFSNLVDSQRRLLEKIGSEILSDVSPRYGYVARHD